MIMSMKINQQQIMSKERKGKYKRDIFFSSASRSNEQMTS